MNIVIRQFIVLIAVQLCFCFATEAEGWVAVDADLSMLQRDAVTSGIFSPQVTYFRTELKDYEVAVVRARDFGWSRATVANLCRASKATLCINANFFDENGDPLGLVVHRGILVQPLHRGGSTLTGIFAVGRSFINIFSRSSFKAAAAVEAVQAGPRLLTAGRLVSGLSNSPRTRRTGVCIDSARRLVLFVTSSSFGGLTFEELQAELLRNEVSCLDALNLDGGGSSQLFLNSKQLPSDHTLEELHVVGRDEIPVALALFLRPPQNTQGSTN